MNRINMMFLTNFLDANGTKMGDTFWVEHFPRKLPEGTEQFTLLLVGGANGLCDTIRLREVPIGRKGAEKVKQQKWS